jgi:hypothetical protein
MKMVEMYYWMDTFIGLKQVIYWQQKEVEMSRTCSTCARNEKCIQKFGLEISNEEVTLEM